MILVDLYIHSDGKISTTGYAISPIIIKIGAAPNREHFVQTRYPPCYRQSDTDDITASTSNPPPPSTIMDASVVFEVHKLK